MMRKPPACDVPKVPTEAPARKGTITQTRQYCLITPLFGGGVEPGQADPITVVRATEVRGHLRFWWRATRGGDYNGDLAAMKAAEDALWGTAASSDDKDKGPSKVAVMVRKWPPEKPKAFAADSKDRNLHIGAPRSKYSYVAFPLNETKGAVAEPFEFTIELSFPDSIIFKEKQRMLQPEIEAALWAWETFGGIGARTRRGFGALQWVNPSDQESSSPRTKDAVKQWITDRLEKHVVAGQWPKDVPHLQRKCSDDWLQVVVLDQKQSAQDVWVHLFTKLKDFRQQRSGRFGRSKWPEPEAIREITGQRLPKHQKMTPLIKKFPRAAFGLPIMFEFKKDDQRKGDPQGKNELLAPKADSDKTFGRWASPLILRPLACANDQSVGIAIILQGTKVPDQLTLNTAGGKKTVHSHLSEEEARKIMKAEDRTPLLKGQTDVLRAFLAFLDSPR